MIHIEIEIFSKVHFSFLLDNDIFRFHFLPQGSQFIQRKTKNATANDSQTFQVVLFGIGPFLQVSFNGTQRIQNILVQCQYRNGTLQISG